MKQVKNKLMSEAIEILIKAKHLLEEELDWCQGHLEELNNNGEVVAVCAIGAINQASKNIDCNPSLYCDIDDNPFFQAWKHLQDSVSNNYDVMISTFNDDPNTTKEDVLLAFKHAIHEAEING